MPFRSGDLVPAHTLYGWGSLLLVLHRSVNRIDVIDVKAHHVIQTLSGISPVALDFAGNQAFAFSLDGAILKITKNENEDLCAVKIKTPSSDDPIKTGVVFGTMAYQIKDWGVNAIDLKTGKSVGEIFLKGLTETAAADPNGLYVTTTGGSLFRLDLKLNQVLNRFQLTHSFEGKWNPPLVKILPLGHRQLAVSNREDGELEIISIP